MGKRVMPSKSNNIEIMVGNENEVTEELIWSFLHMYFFFHLCFLLQTFTIHRTAGKGGAYLSLIPVYHFRPALNISRAITAASSTLHIASRLKRGTFGF